MDRVDLERAESLHLDARDAAYGWEGHALSREEARSICEALSATPALLARLRALEALALAAEALASAEDRYEVLCGERLDDGGHEPCVLIEAGNAYDDAHKGLRAALAATKEKT